MFSYYPDIAILLVIGLLSAAARGAVYITSPHAASTCRGGQPCTIEWLDDGTEPLLASIGPSNFALHFQTNTLVQQIKADFDVSSARSLTFTPDPNAGPNADTYFIWITSASAKDPNNTQVAYQSFSHAFTIDGMTGSASARVPADTHAPAPAPAPSPSAATHTSNSTAASATPSNGVIGTTTLPPPPGLAPPSSAPSATPASSSPSPSGFSPATKPPASPSASTSGAPVSVSSSASRRSASVVSSALSAAVVVVAAAALLAV